MPFSIQCSNKGCCKIMEPYLDPNNDKVYCSICDNELTNVTIFVKSQMKSSKQYKQKKMISFAVKCQNCSKEDRPVLLNNKILCPYCNKEHLHLSEPFKNMLRLNLKTVGQDV